MECVMRMRYSSTRSDDSNLAILWHAVNVTARPEHNLRYMLSSATVPCDIRRAEATETSAQFEILCSSCVML